MSRVHAFFKGLPACGTKLTRAVASPPPEAKVTCLVCLKKKAK